MKNLLIDCETLDTAETAIIPMYAAIIMDSEKSIMQNIKDNLFITHPLISEQEEKGRTRSEGTMKFWQERPKEVYDQVMSQDKSKSIQQTCEDFITFLKDRGFYDDKSAFIWQRGTKDEAWLISLFASVNQSPPFNWWSVRELRTAIDVMQGSSKLNGYLDANLLSEDASNTLNKLQRNNMAHHPAYDVIRDFSFLRSLGIV